MTETTDANNSAATQRHDEPLTRLANDLEERAKLVNDTMATLAKLGSNNPIVVLEAINTIAASMRAKGNTPDEIAATIDPLVGMNIQYHMARQVPEVAIAGQPLSPAEAIYGKEAPVVWSEEQIADFAALVKKNQQILFGKAEATPPPVAAPVMPAAPPKPQAA